MHSVALCYNDFLSWTKRYRRKSLGIFKIYNCTSIEGIFRVDIEQIETTETAIPKGNL